MKFLHYETKLYLLSYPLEPLNYAIVKNNNDMMFKNFPHLFYQEINPDSKIEQDIKQLYTATYDHSPLNMHIYEIPLNTIIADDIDLCKPKTINKICTAINELHEYGYYHGDMMTNHILIDPEQNIHFTHCINSKKLHDGWKDIIKDRVNFHLQIINKKVTSDLLKFLDYYLFARSFQDTVHMYVNEFVIDDENYNKFLAMTCILHSTIYIDMEKCIFSAKFDYLSSIFMQVPFTGNIVIDAVIHGWNKMFHDIQKYNEPNSMWLSHNMYTDYDYMYKRYDRLYRGDDLRVNEYIKVEYMQTDCSNFDLYVDISYNKYRMNYDIEYYALERWKTDDKRILKAIKVIEYLQSKSFFHGQLSAKNVFSHIMSMEIQIINCEHSRLLDISNCMTRNDITLELTEDIVLTDNYLFFYDMFTFALSIYNEKLVIETDNEMFNRAWSLLKGMTKYDRDCFTMNMKNLDLLIVQNFVKSKN